jgi:uncharacterized protein (DUF2141 family)
VHASIIPALVSAVALTAQPPTTPGAPPAQPPAVVHVLRVLVSGVKSAVGHIRLDVCTRAEFLKDCSFSAAAPAIPGETTLLLAGLPPGVYAVQAYHDKNDNHEVDRNALGLPTEGVGFSNGVKIRLRAPTFKAAAFVYLGGDETISLRLQHFAD